MYRLFSIENFTIFVQVCTSYKVRFSQVFTHLSTTQAHRCLTTEYIGEVVLYLIYHVNLKVAYDPVDWGCRILWLHLSRGVRLPQWISWIWHKKSHGESPIILEFWGMRSTSLLPILPGCLRPGVVAPDMAPSMCPIWHLNCALWHLNWVQRNV